MCIHSEFKIKSSWQHGSLFDHIGPDWLVVTTPVQDPRDLAVDILQVHKALINWIRLPNLQECKPCPLIHSSSILNRAYKQTPTHTYVIKLYNPVKKEVAYLR